MEIKIVFQNRKHADIGSGRPAQSKYKYNYQSISFYISRLNSSKFIKFFNIFFKKIKKLKYRLKFIYFPNKSN